MTRIGDNAGIRTVKEHFALLKEIGLVQQWELPYEHILTRLDAAIFFCTPAAPATEETLWQELAVHPALKYSLNTDKKLSQLQYRVEFNNQLETQL